MYTKIYFGDKPLFLCDALDDQIQPYVHHDDAVFIDELNAHTIKTVIHEMEQPQVHAGIFYHEDLVALNKAFLKKFTLVKAAGGLVKNEKNQLLLIFRRGKWDLPKGKLDSEEALETCAVREVKEETGLKNLTVISPFSVTFHTYHEGSKHVLKETHWYTMRVTGTQTLLPQTEEDIAAIEWVSIENMKPYLENSYQLIRDLINIASEKKLLAL